MEILHIIDIKIRYKRKRQYYRYITDIKIK